MDYLYSVADYPIYYNSKNVTFDVYTSTSINGKLIVSCPDQMTAIEEAKKRYESIYGKIK